MPAKDGFLLTEGDIDYLRSVYLLRLATIDHLAALSSGSKGQARSYTRTQRRTAKLAAHGYLDALTRPPRKTLYALGKEGMAVLVELGYAPEELLAKRPRHQELKDLFLNHFLLVKNIQVKILLLLRGTSIRLVKWIEGEELYDAVTIQENQGQKSVAVRIPVRPDAFFVIQDTTRPEGKNLIPFTLEADRGTESHERLRTKIKGYVHYFQQDLAFKKWGFQFFRVFTVTETAARAHNLRNDLQDLIPSPLRPHYLFTGIETLTLNTLIPQEAATAA
jgi:Replication-relaxation